ncbi:trypsin-like serine protease [Sorangium sp. So ce1014]|uniref:trypsin-like serine protease n=1 Tax=Sorangium sp. So ce1014 TaxID=3133326 RepID=UPI003F621D7F
MKLRIYLDPSGQSTSARGCTAALIAPKVLLTTAHCMDFPHRTSGPVGEAFLGTTVSAAGYWVNVKEAHYDHEWDKSNKGAGHDIAVAILEEPVYIEPLPYNRTPMTEAMVGAPVRLIGFGLDDEGFDDVSERWGSPARAGRSAQKPMQLA